MNHFKSINPFTLQVLSEHALHNVTEISAKLNKAEKAFANWKTLRTSERCQYFLRLASVLRKNKTSYAQLITNEMGKPITESLAEIEKCASVCEFYAENAETLSSNEKLKTDASNCYITYQPLGVILAIMPWNFPFWQVFRFAIPTLIAGNTALLKHAINVIGCAETIEKAFEEAGFEMGVFQSLTIDNATTAQLIQDFRIKGVSVTGSTIAGKAVASVAGANLKKTVLELGGSDPFIVLEDADLDKAAEIGIVSRMQNAGQVCIAAKRFIVAEKIKDQFLEKIILLSRHYKPANPLLESAKMGPMAKLDLAETIERQYRETLRHGAIAHTDFHRENCLVQPMILDNVQTNSPAFHEETFGPLAAIISAKNENHAIELANHSTFGLGATIFSEDKEKAEKLGLQIQCGSVFINAMVRSDPRFPIGGINNSGYGRELYCFGMQEFTNAKTIYIS